MYLGGQYSNSAGPTAYIRIDLTNYQVYWSIYTTFTNSYAVEIFPIYEDPVYEGGNYISLQYTGDTSTNTNIAVP